MTASHTSLTTIRKGGDKTRKQSEEAKLGNDGINSKNKHYGIPGKEG